MATDGEKYISTAEAKYAARERAYHEPNSSNDQPKTTSPANRLRGQEDKDKEETLQRLQDAKTSDANDPVAIAADVGFEENCKAVIDMVVKKYGRIDILVNNAAEQQLSNSLDDITECRLERVFRTNIFSQFYFSRYALKHMSEGSSIINSTSAGAYSGNPMTLDYTAAKGAIVAFTRGLALQLADKGICVAPGLVWTPLQAASCPLMLSRNLNQMYLSRGLLSPVRLLWLMSSLRLRTVLLTSLAKFSIPLASFLSGNYLI